MTTWTGVVSYCEKMSNDKRILSAKGFMNNLHIPVYNEFNEYAGYVDDIWIIEHSNVLWAKGVWILAEFEGSQEITFDLTPNWESVEYKDELWITKWSIGAIYLNRGESLWKPLSCAIWINSAD